jgi:sugar lactone lactonase YvrE
MRRLLLVLALSAVLPSRLVAQADLLVSGFTSQAIHRYDALGGAPLGTVAAAPGAQSLRYGPDGFLYACAEEADRVLRLDGVTGAFVADFVWDDPTTPADESGGLDAPTAAVFGPDGHLYVASFSQDRVLRCDGQTGAYLGDFIAPGASVLDGPDAGMTFGPDGHLYVPSFEDNRVQRYDGATGAFLDTFVKPVEGLSRPRMLRFRGDGSLWVTSWGNSRLLRFDLDGILATTVPLGVFRPTGLVIDPASGNLLVTSDQTSDVRLFDGLTGAAKGTLVPSGSGGLVGGTFLEYLPDREVTLSRLTPGLTGAGSTLALRGGTPHAVAYLLYGFAPQAQQVGPCKAWIGVQVAGALPFALDAAGAFQLPLFLDASLAGTALYLQGFDPSTCRASNLVIQTLP